MLIIPDREMPKCCAECPCLHHSPPLYCQALKGKTWIVPTPYLNRPKWCPLQSKEDKPTNN